MKTSYSLSTVIGEDLIASFVVYVNGSDVIVGDVSGNSDFTGEVFTVADDSKDIPVSFAISSSSGWTANGSDTLRGDHPFDDTTFSNNF